MTLRSVVRLDGSARCKAVSGRERVNGQNGEIDERVR